MSKKPPVMLGDDVKKTPIKKILKERDAEEKRVIANAKRRAKRAGTNYGEAK